MKERKQKARWEDRQARIEERIRRKEEKGKRIKLGDTPDDYLPTEGENYTAPFEEPDLHPTKWKNGLMDKNLRPKGTILTDIKTGSLIGAIVGLVYRNHLRMHFDFLYKVIYALYDVAVGASLGALIGWEMGYGNGKKMGFNITDRSKEEQRQIAKAMFRGTLWGMFVGWLWSEIKVFGMKRGDPFGVTQSKAGIVGWVDPLAALWEKMSPYFPGPTRCPVKVDKTVATGWDLAAYVRKPWYAQSMMESWYQPLDSFPCTEARYLAKTTKDEAGKEYTFTIPKYGEENPEVFGKQWHIDVSNRAAKKKSMLGVREGVDTKGTLCARRVSKHHGLFVGPCLIPQLPDDVNDAEDKRSDEAPAPINYWVIAYDEKEYGGYAIVIGGQPDVEAPDGTCNFLENDSKGMWILTRRRNPKPEDIQKLKDKMHDELNMDTSEMKDVPQFDCLDRNGP